MPVCVGICDRRIFDQCHAKVWGNLPEGLVTHFGNGEFT